MIAAALPLASSVPHRSRFSVASSSIYRLASDVLAKEMLRRRRCPCSCGPSGTAAACASILPRATAAGRQARCMGMVEVDGWMDAHDA